MYIAISVYYYCVNVIWGMWPTVISTMKIATAQWFIFKLNNPYTVKISPTAGKA